jgi:hypothetical protein
MAFNLPSCARCSDAMRFHLQLPPELSTMFHSPLLSITFMPVLGIESDGS